MSRNRTRSRNSITLDKNELQRLISAEVARRYTPPQGANVQPIPQNIINQMMQQQAPQGKTGGMWEPGAPIPPIPGLSTPQGPRAWQYPVGYNIGQLPRSTEMTAFETLRNLAALYDGIQLCLQVWYDLCSKPELEIKPRPDLLKDEHGDPVPPDEIHAKYGARITKWKAFFAKPDKDQDMNLKAWMRAALREVLTVDALAIFKHKDRVGRIYALELIDGAHIKPLVTERGRKPSADFPAYEQFLHGTPSMFLRRDELIYKREVERVDSIYGFSRVEKIILRVNQALRKQNKDLATFTDGNMPAGTLEPPDDGTTDWTPEQLLVYQSMWDGMLSGNDAMKSRIKVIPPGAKFNKTDPDDIMTPFDTFLLNVTVGDFGLTMSELGFTETVNKSSGETQEAVIYRRAMSPIMDLFSEMFTDVMVEDGETDLVAGWKAFEEPEDFKTKAEAWKELVLVGIQSTSQAANALGLKALVETTPFVLTKEGITFLEDIADPNVRKIMREAQMAAQQQQGGGNEQGAQPGAKGTPSAVGGKQGAGGGTAKGATNGTGKSAQTRGAHDAGTTTRSLEPALPGQSSDAERALHAEYRRWRECAIKDTASGKPVRAFKSDLIPAEQHKALSEMLALCRTPETVRAVFPVFREAKDDELKEVAL